MWHQFLHHTSSMVGPYFLSLYAVSKFHCVCVAIVYSFIFSKFITCHHSTVRDSIASKTRCHMWISFQFCWWKNCILRLCAWVCGGNYPKLQSYLFIDSLPPTASLAWIIVFNHVSPCCYKSPSLRTLLFVSWVMWLDLWNMLLSYLKWWSSPVIKKWVTLCTVTSATSWIISECCES